MDSTSSTLQYPLVCSDRDCALCAWDCVNFVSGTVNYVSRTLHCVRGTVNFVHTHDEYMYQTANVLSTLESCVSCFSKLQSVPVCLYQSLDTYLQQILPPGFTTNSSCVAGNIFTVLNFQLISKQFLCISNKPLPLVSSVLGFIRELLWKCSSLPRAFGAWNNFVFFPFILLLYPEL